MHGPIYEAVGVICRRSRSKRHCAFRQARIISKESSILVNKRATDYNLNNMYVNKGSYKDKMMQLQVRL